MALVPQPSIPIGMGQSLPQAARPTIKWDDAGSTHTHAMGTWTYRMDPDIMFNGFICAPFQAGEQQVQVDEADDQVGHMEDVD